MLDRDSIMQKAINECYEEMYHRAQPSADYKELIEKVKSGELQDSYEDPIYNRHYLSQEEFQYIRDKYKDAYGFKSHWNSDIELLESYLLNGGSKDKFIPTTMDDTGYIKPGYRSYETVQPLVKQLRDIIQDDSKTKTVIETVFEMIKNCKNFYRFDREEQQFEISVTLGCSPTSNKQTVIDYWKSKGDNITIKDRNPLLFWDEEYYGNDLAEVMEEEYGPNWEEYWDNKHKEHQVEIKSKKDNEMKELKNSKFYKFKVGDVVRCKEDKLPREVISINDTGYRITGGFIPFSEDSNWYHCYEQFKHYL